jgi:hypothetical protein
MAKVPNAAKKAARERMTREGENYTTALRHVLTVGSTQQPPDVAMRDAVAKALAGLGWPAPDTGIDDETPVAYAGPCDVMRLAVETDEEGLSDGEDARTPQDDPAGRKMYVTGLAPTGWATVDDFDFSDIATTPAPDLARSIDRELAQARARRTAQAAEEADTGCAICGDRYPADHLITNSPAEGADPVCPACIFDGDLPFRTHVPHLAFQLDTLEREDLAAPAGWAAIAALLSLAIAGKVGTAGSRWLTGHGMNSIFAHLDRRWNTPVDDTWIWLPPAEHRHPAFTSLGAGASLRVVVDTLEAGIPDIKTRAKRECRYSDVRWRETIWPAVVAYAVTFTTQASERPQHRKPVHVIASLDDALYELSPEGFSVRGDAGNVAGMLECVLERVLFPALLGHGLHDEPKEPARVYGAADGDDRPARRPQDAQLMHATERAVAINLSLNLGPAAVLRTARLWDLDPALPAAQPAPGPAHEQPAGGQPAPIGPSAAVTAEVAEIRTGLLIEAAGALYDNGGRQALTAANAWNTRGIWVIPDDADVAVHQAQHLLTGRPRVLAVWAGPSGQWDEPISVCVDVTAVMAHSRGPVDVPWLQVWDGESQFALQLRELAAILRADPSTELTALWTD